MDEPGMSLLDQSVIKKGKEWRASARAEPGEMVQAPAHRPSFFPCGASLLCVAKLILYQGKGTLLDLELICKTS